MGDSLRPPPSLEELKQRAEQAIAETREAIAEAHQIVHEATMYQETIAKEESNGMR